MINPSKLFDPPTNHEIELACHLRDREYRLFSTLLRLLTDPDCRARLTCRTPLTAKLKRPTSQDRFTSAFLRCYRLLSQPERKRTKAFLIDALWQSYVANVAPNSYLHRSWFTADSEPDSDHDFLSWCAGKSCHRLSAADSFWHLVRLNCGVMRQNFMELWSLLTPQSTAKLRAMLWRIIQCGAQSIDTVMRGHHPRFLIIARTFTAEI